MICPLTCFLVKGKFVLLISQFSFSYWFLVSFHCGQRKYVIDISLFKFIEDYLLPNMVCFGECSVCIWEECIFCSWWAECSVYVCYFYLIYSVHVFLIFCLDVPAIVENGVLESLSLVYFTVSFSFQLSAFAYVFWSFLHSYNHLLDEWFLLLIYSVFCLS